MIAAFVSLAPLVSSGQTVHVDPDEPDEPVHLAQLAGPIYPTMGGGGGGGQGGAYAPGVAGSGVLANTPNDTTLGPKQPPLVASVGITETLTNNVNLTSSNLAQTDLVTQITPQLNVNEQGTHASLNGFLAAPILLYARTTENNQIYPSIGLLGRVEAVDRFFFVEGAVSVSQQYFTPFGGQPVGLSNATNNRYTSASYRVSPYIQGSTPGNIQYQLRNNNLWTNFYSTPTSANNVYYDQWLGNVQSPVETFGWAADYEGDWVKFQGQGPLVTNLGRGRLLYQADPQVRLTLSGGYEDNRYTFTDYSGPIYGVGIRWIPDPRTNLVANWEHRFFGSSYYFNFDHRGPLSVFSVLASRGISSYPQQLLSIGATTNTSTLLNLLFSSLIPDPTQRQTFIDQLIQDRGLPSSLTSPVNLYAQQTLLIEDATATVGLLGARNSIFLTGFYLRSEPITGAGNPLPPLLAAGNNNTQKGAGLTWTHNLSATLVLNTSATLLQTVANAPLVGKTNQGIVSVTATARLSPNTSVFAGGRYQKLTSDVTTNYNEAAIFAGLYYIFK
jgi:uncharacterized protein (PEP-CTERM system associated)